MTDTPDLASIKRRHEKEPVLPALEGNMGSAAARQAYIDRGRLLTALSAAEAKIAELTAQQYVPGVWRCPKCNFRLMQSNLNANTGTVTARDDPGDKCPNCDAPLWRVSWKNEAHENLTIGEQQVARAVAAEAKVRELEAALRPFAKCADDSSLLGDEAVLFRCSRRDLRTAAAAMQKEKEG